MPDLLGYARVSTLDQNADLQLDALNAAGCIKVFVDKASGSVDARPELDKLFEQLRRKDTLVVWKLDRLGRSLHHLVATMKKMEFEGVAFRSLQENIDTGSPTGRLVFHVFAALAEFERDLIRERTMAGLAAARARGRRGGRKPVMTPEQVRLAHELRDSDKYTIGKIAKVLGVSRATVYRHLAATPADRRGE